MRKIQSAKPVFPVNLLLEGKACLVVGGGRTAFHKARLLRQAQARLTIVSPDIVPDLATLVDEGVIEWLRREVRGDDVDGFALVYAATDDRAVNAAVRQACSERNILCCSVDRNWPESDFITPATFRHSGLVVTVSTGGRSCRHSRLVKDTLERHIQLVENTDLLVMGTDHRMLPIDARESYHLTGDDLDRTGTLLSQIWGIQEFALLNTCNRIEVLAAVTRETPVETLIGMILGFDRLSADAFYIRRGKEAFEHTGMLCAGLLSQMPGENHIVAQVKEAVDHAETRQWAGGIMREWLDSALHISKHIRNSTRDELRSREIEDLCISYLDDACSSLEGSPVMVIGTGVVGRELVAQLVQRGATCTWCYHVNRPDLPETWESSVTLQSLDALADLLPDHDLTLCATGGGAPILHAEHTARIPDHRHVTLIDLAMPRNVSPDAVADTPNVTYLDLDGLKTWYRREMIDLGPALEASQAITHEHADFYDKLIRSIQGGNP